MTADLTVLYYTANVLREPFGARVRDQLRRAIGDLPLISVSQQPLPGFGHNIVLHGWQQSFLNIWRQVLIGARAATTEFVAMAEDDVLYPPAHFTDFRPKGDEFAYDMCKWSLYTWTAPPVFSHKHRHTMTSMVCPTALLIETLEERFARYPGEDVPIHYWGEPGRYERHLRIAPRKLVEYEAATPHVIFSHPEAVGYGFLGRRKRLGDIQATEIPFWGTAEQVREMYDG